MSRADRDADYEEPEPAIVRTLGLLTIAVSTYVVVTLAVALLTRALDAAIAWMHS